MIVLIGVNQNNLNKSENHLANSTSRSEDMKTFTHSKFLQYLYRIEYQSNLKKSKCSRE